MMFILVKTLGESCRQILESGRKLYALISLVSILN